ncbi:MAG: hypothetical protein KGL63_13745 [Betaproteobacteria bacterium]|nr:hypothetical protein [Betaproteobacteria bacterium]
MDELKAAMYGAGGSALKTVGAVGQFIPGTDIGDVAVKKGQELYSQGAALSPSAAARGGAAVDIGASLLAGLGASRIIPEAVSLGGRILRAGGIGGVTGATTSPAPVGSKGTDFAAQKATQFGEWAIPSMAFPVVGKAMEKYVAPLAEKWRLGGKAGEEALAQTAERTRGEALDWLGRRVTDTEAEVKKANILAQQLHREAAATTAPAAEKAVPEPYHAIGTEARTGAVNYVEELRAARNAQANADITKYVEEARAQEATGKRLKDTEAFKSLLADIDKNITDAPSGSQLRAKLMQLKQELTQGTLRPPQEGGPATAKIFGQESTYKGKQPLPSKAISFDTAELIRRELGEAFSTNPEGYAAINSNMRRNFYTKLSEAMKEFNPKFDTYLSNYRKASEKLDVVGTKLGKAFTESEVPGTDFMKVDVEKLPSRMFDSVANFQKTIELMGGDKAKAAALARRYFMSQATDKTSAQIRTMLRDPKLSPILKETGAAKMLEDHAARVANTEARTAGAEAQRKALETRAGAQEAQAVTSREHAQQLEGIKNWLNKTPPDRVVQDLDNTLKGAVKSGAIKQADYDQMVAKVRSAQEQYARTKDAQAFRKRVNQAMGAVAGTSLAYYALHRYIYDMLSGRK